MVFPFIVTQGLWVASRAVQLPAPEGARSGVAGQGTRLRILIVGDSSAEGVGVTHQDAALSGRILDRLCDDFTVEWRVIAASGATAADTAQRLQAAAPGSFDIAITALGVNDTKNGVSTAAWQENYQAVFALLRSKFQTQHIIACGLPPIQDFPLLPNPLRSVLARRALHFEEILQEVVETDAAVAFLPMPERLDPTRMSKDGFHPGSQIYDEWGTLVAAAIRDILDQRAMPPAPEKELQ